MKHLKVNLPVTPQLLADIMEIAESECIDSWCDIIAFTKTEDPEMFRMEIIELDSPDDERDPQHYTITTETILQGMQKIIDLDAAEYGPQVKQIQEWIISCAADDDASMIDTMAADAIIEVALFGEWVYN